MFSFPHLRFFWIIVLVFAMLAALSDQKSSLAVDNTALRVGVENYYPPFSFPDENGHPAGFDPAIAETLCRAMERTCEIQALPFDQLLNAIREGKLDLVVAGLAASEERKKYMDFSESYYHSRTIYIGRPGSEASQTWMKGKRIGAQTSTQQAVIAAKLWGDIAEIVLNKNYADMLTELSEGKLDIVISDGLPGYEFLRSERGEEFIMIEVDLPLDEELNSAHIGIRKNEPDLLKAVNKAIQDVKLNGEYDRVARRYFPFSIY